MYNDISKYLPQADHLKLSILLVLIDGSLIMLALVYILCIVGLQREAGPAELQADCVSFIGTEIPAGGARVLG